MDPICSVDGSRYVNSIIVKNPFVGKWNMKEHQINKHEQHERAFFFQQV